MNTHVGDMIANPVNAEALSRQDGLRQELARSARERMLEMERDKKEWVSYSRPTLSFVSEWALLRMIVQIADNPAMFKAFHDEFLNYHTLKDEGSRANSPEMLKLVQESWRHACGEYGHLPHREVYHAYKDEEKRYKAREGERLRASLGVGASVFGMLQAASAWQLTPLPLIGNATFGLVSALTTYSNSLQNDSQAREEARENFAQYFFEPLLRAFRERIERFEAQQNEMCVQFVATADRRIHALQAKHLGGEVLSAEEQRQLLGAYALEEITHDQHLGAPAVLGLLRIYSTPPTKLPWKFQMERNDLSEFPYLHDAVLRAYDRAQMTIGLTSDIGRDVCHHQQKGRRAFLKASGYAMLGGALGLGAANVSDRPAITQATGALLGALSAVEAWEGWKADKAMNAAMEKDLQLALSNIGEMVAATREKDHASPALRR
jgi:hypothetical protein